MDNLQHPAITNAMKFGYGFPADPPLLCDDCGEDIGEYGYRPYGDALICEDCFVDWAQELISCNPREAADALSVDFFYLG